MIEWVDPKILKPDPENPNEHSDQQINRLCEIIKFQGWRHPIIVSNQDGMIKAGHGRLMAALKMGLETVPVSYQDFTPEQAYAFLVSDNAIASWSDLNLSKINFKLPELGPEFDVNLLGIKNLVIDPAEKSQNYKKEKTEKIVQCPNCGEQFNGSSSH